MRPDPLGLNQRQYDAIHDLEGKGWALTYLGTVVGGDPRFHAYKAGENLHLWIDEEGKIAWADSSRSTPTTAGSSSS